MPRLYLEELEGNNILDLKNVRISFHNRLTVLAGQNSMGKTMIIGSSVLALLGLRGLLKPWNDKIRSDNLTRKKVEGRYYTTLKVRYGEELYDFTYPSKDERQRIENLKNLGVDNRALTFLTSSERRPPWRSVEEDIRDVLRRGLESSIETRIRGCRSVIGVFESEVDVLKSKRKDVQDKINEIKDEWFAQGIFKEDELGKLGSAFINERLEYLKEQKNKLEGIERWREFEKVREGLEGVKDLREILGKIEELGGLLKNLEELSGKLSCLDKNGIHELINEIKVPSELISDFEIIKTQSEKLVKSLSELIKFGITPESFEDVTSIKTECDDDKEIINYAKKMKMLKGAEKGIRVKCTVYHKKPLLVELDEDFVKKLKHEEIKDAKVVPPYSESAEKRVTKILENIDEIHSLYPDLKKNIGNFEANVKEIRSDLRTQSEVKKVELRRIAGYARDLECPETSLVDSETGERIEDTINWLDSEMKRLEDSLRTTADEIRDFISKLREKEMDLEDVISKDKEKIRSLKERKANFLEHLSERDLIIKEIKSYENVTEVLNMYINELTFSEEAIKKVSDRFRSYVEKGKGFFRFPFDLDWDEKERLILRRKEEIEGPIVGGGGETQILGLLEMLAVADEFRLPVFIDEFDSYLHGENPRKVLEFILEHSDAQVIITTGKEWIKDLSGRDCYIYSVEKEDNWTVVERV